MTLRPLSCRFWLAQVASLESECDGLRERIAAFRRFGYHASADTLADRLDRRESSLAFARGKVLVTPSISGQFDTAARKSASASGVSAVPLVGGRELGGRGAHPSEATGGGLAAQGGVARPELLAEGASLSLRSR
jgi:hypothetical protein